MKHTQLLIATVPSSAVPKRT